MLVQLYYKRSKRHADGSPSVGPVIPEVFGWTIEQETKREEISCKDTREKGYCISSETLAAAKIHGWEFWPVPVSSPISSMISWRVSTLVTFSNPNRCKFPVRLFPSPRLYPSS